MKKSPTPIILCFAIVILMVSFVGMLFFVQKISEKNTHTALVLATLESKIKEKENHTLLEKKVAEAKDVHARISEYFVDADTIDTFITTVESLGSTTHTSVSVTNVASVANTPNTLSLNMSGRGTFEDVMKLASLLEALPYSIHIKNAFLNKDIQIKDGLQKSNNQWQLDILFIVLHA